MNVTTWPSTRDFIKSDGTINAQHQNFFMLNTQEQARYFSNDGHLVPTRTTEDLDTLSTTQYTARFAYNMETDNHMANTAGEYKNLTMNVLTTRTDIIAMTALPERIEQYGDENDFLYTNVNGDVQQNLTISLDFPMQFSTDGTNLSVDINGVISDVVLTDPTIPINFTSFDGTDLFLTINGTPRKIVTAAP